MTLAFQWSKNSLGDALFLFRVCNSIQLPFLRVKVVHLLSSSNVLDTVIASIDEEGLRGLLEELIAEFLVQNTQRRGRGSVQNEMGIQN